MSRDSLGGWDMDGNVWRIATSLEEIQQILGRIAEGIEKLQPTTPPGHWNEGVWIYD